MQNRVLIFLCLVLFSAPGMARNYSVEAIIFSHTATGESTTEEWDATAPRNIRAQNRLETLYHQAEDDQKTRELTAEQAPESVPVENEESEDTETPITTTVVHKLDLLESYRQSLEEHPDHGILQTLSWQQSEANYKESPLIPILTPQLKGVIRVYAPNLLFTELTLVYIPEGEIGVPTDAEGEVTDPPASVTSIDFASIQYSGEFAPQNMPPSEPMRYYLEEQRKLKLKEVHYFDNPRFGVILNVVPIEEQKTIQ